jgi:hypothetical protein
MTDSRKLLGGSYDSPDYLVMRTHWQRGAYSCSTNDSTYSGPSFRCYTKALILGVHLAIGSGGSAAGVCTIGISRAGTSDTLSVMQVVTTTLSAGASASNDCIDIEMTTPFTLESIGMAAVIEGAGSSAVSHCPVLKDVTFRYKLLP